MRSAANSHVKMATVSRRVPDTSVRGSRSYHAENKSKPACLHRRGAREKSGILNINTPIFYLLRKNRFNWTNVRRKKLGSPAILRFYFKKPPFPIAIHTKTDMLFGQHFDGGLPRNLNHEFLWQFDNGFNKKLACLCSKAKMTEPP